MSTQSLKVDSENSQLRLDVYLARTLPDGPSRTFVKELIDTGQVSVNHRRVKAHYKVCLQDLITVNIPEEVFDQDKVKPEHIPLKVFFEDEDLLVINKAAGMLVHPAKGCYTGTLVNALLYHCQNLSDFNTAFRPGIVHRLDRETSGLMVIAKNNKTHANLARQFEKRLVKKRYIALVEGLVEFEEGLVDASLGRHPRYRDRKAVAFDDEARKAKTFYRVIKRLDKATFVALLPRTGRTHQLRVHMAYLGHPILGDDKYGKKNSFSRLALHAQSIGFFHPSTTKFVEFSCPPPAEFLQFGSSH